MTRRKHFSNSPAWSDPESSTAEVANLTACPTRVPAFFDGAPARLEITVRTEQADSWPKLVAAAPGELEKWNALKKRKYGQSEKPTGSVPAMPADSTIVPA